MNPASWKAENVGQLIERLAFDPAGDEHQAKLADAEVKDFRSCIEAGLAKRACLLKKIGRAHV